jgi:hypothetical protein
MAKRVSKARMAAERAERAMARSLERLRAIAVSDKRPVTPVRIHANKDGSIDGQVLIGGNWKDAEHQLVDLFGLEAYGAVPKDFKVSIQLRFAATDIADEEPEGYRRKGGLPTIQFHYRKPENFPLLVNAAQHAAEGISDRWWEIKSVALDLRYEPERLAQARRVHVSTPRKKGRKK